MVQGQQCNMVMTSVSGHLLGLDFDERHRKWYSCEPIQLFEATLVKTCVDKNMINIKVNCTIFVFLKKHMLFYGEIEMVLSSVCVYGRMFVLAGLIFGHFFDKSTQLELAAFEFFLDFA